MPSCATYSSVQSLKPSNPAFERWSGRRTPNARLHCADAVQCQAKGESDASRISRERWLCDRLPHPPIYSIRRSESYSFKTGMFSKSPIYSESRAACDLPSCTKLWRNRLHAPAACTKRIRRPVPNDMPSFCLEMLASEEKRYGDSPDLRANPVPGCAP